MQASVVCVYLSLWVYQSGADVCSHEFVVHGDPSLWVHHSGDDVFLQELCVVGDLHCGFKKVELMSVCWNQLLAVACHRGFTKVELMSVCRNQLLLAVARQRGFTKVVLGDTATLLSVRIMTDMAKGKGSQVSFDTVSQLCVCVCVCVCMCVCVRTCM